MIKWFPYPFPKKGAMILSVGPLIYDLLYSRKIQSNTFRRGRGKALCTAMAMVSMQLCQATAGMV